MRLDPDADMCPVDGFRFTLAPPVWEAVNEQHGQFQTKQLSHPLARSWLACGPGGAVPHQPRALTCGCLASALPSIMRCLTNCVPE